MAPALGLLARRAVLVPPACRLSNPDMSGRSDLAACGLRAGCLRRLDRYQRDDRHRADCDPGNCDARDVLPGQTTSPTSGTSSADDRFHLAQSRNRIANRGLLGHAGLAELSHAIVKMAFELPDQAAVFQPSAAQRLGEPGQELGFGVVANLEPPRAPARTQSRSRDSGAASSQPARGAQSDSSARRRTRVGAGR